MPGGKKKKIAIEKIEKKESRAVAFSKRRPGLFSKSAQFCLRSDDPMAILVAPLSSESNVSFYGFGHSSVDVVVNAFLANQCPPPPPPRDEELGFWWDDERVANSDNPDLLREAVDSIMETLQGIKELGKQIDCEELKKKKKKKNKGVSHGTQQNQPVNPEPCSTKDLEGLESHGCNQEFDLDELYDFVTNSESLAIPDNNNNNDVVLGGFNEEIDLDQFNFTFDPEFDLDQVPYGGD